MTRRIGTIALLILLTALSWAQDSGIVSKIDVQGNKEIGTQAILNAMRSKVGQPFLQSNLDLDKQGIEDMGFFQSVDVRAQVADKNNWDIVVNVLEYPVVKEIRIVGNTVVKTPDIRKVLTVEIGKVFNLRDQVTSSRRIQDLYQKKGYFALVEEFAPMRESPNTVNIVIREPIINSVSVEGNYRTRMGVLRKLIHSRAGEVYDKHKWEMDLRRLWGTQWFSSVKSSDKQSPDDPFKIDLLADVKEQRTGTFNIGLQMDPRSSFAGVIKLQDSNFNGSGQGIGVDFLQATTGGGPSVGIDYSNPFMDNRGTSFHASVYSRLLYRFTGSIFGGNSNPSGSGTYTERRTGLSAGISKPVDDYSAWGIGGRLERVITNDLESTNLQGFIKQDGDLGIATLGYTQNRRDTDIDPSRGYYFHFEADPGFSDITSIGGSVLDPSILGTHPFMKYSADLRAYFTNQPPRAPDHLDDPRHVLALRLMYGSLTGKVPFFEQYFAGGAQTIRGYDEDRFWGNHTIISSAELRFPIQKAFSIIGFVDYGGAWGGYGTVNDFTQSSNFKLHLGYGLGFSFRTPLGPLRLDLGFDERGKTRTDFLIGTSF